MNSFLPEDSVLAESVRMIDNLSDSKVFGQKNTMEKYPASSVREQNYTYPESNLSGVFQI
jgi:hypothetical protein